MAPPGSRQRPPVSHRQKERLGKMITMESQTLFKLPEFLPAVRSPGGKLGHIIPPLGSASAPDTLCKRQCTRIKRILFQHPPLTAQVSVAPHGHDGPQRLIIPLRHLAGLLENTWYTPDWESAQSM